MCGILGIFGNTDYISEEKFSDSLALLSHRGPDGTGIYKNENCIFGHKRLSIIDIKAGHQPMFSNDKRYAIIFNGEIYNYKELKSVFSNYNYKTDSDTEVILSVFSKIGTDVLHELEGMFAFSIYDSQQNSILLARDNFGIKPLFYYKEKEFLIFSSEMKSIIDLICTPFQISGTSILNYFKYKFIPNPNTIYRNIQKLEQGHYLKCTIDEKNQVNIQKFKYFDVLKKNTVYSINFVSKEDIYNILRKKIISSVKKHLVSDVPVGVLLSGGLDSTIITYSATQTEYAVDTYTIGFKNCPDDLDLKYSRFVADEFKTNHHEILVGEFDTKDFSKLISSFDEPFADPALIPSYILAKEISKHEKVVMSGDGGDEFFYGYDSYYDIGRISNYRKFLTKPFLSSMSKLLNYRYTDNFFLHRFAKYVEPKDEDFITSRYFNYKKSDLKYLFSQEFLNEQLKKPSLLKDFICSNKITKNIRNMDLKYSLPDYYLRKVDITSMQNSLEIRVPFISKEIFELANSLPISFHFHGNSGKYLLKKAFEKDIPIEILKRSKKGFTRSWYMLFGDNIKNVLFDTIITPKITDSGIFNMDSLENLINTFNPKNFVANNLLWRLLVFCTWYNNLGSNSFEVS